MNQPKLMMWRIISRNLAVMLFLIVSAVAYATLGDGKGKNNSSNKSILSNKSVVKLGSFSLKSGYTFRGNHVINIHGEKRYIQLDTDITVQKGSTSYIVPLKKKVILDNVKIDISNRQLRRN